MVPVVSVVGKSDVGKTTLIVKLLPELKRRGYRVATVKHDVHGFQLDQPGKDSWRHGEAGSDIVVISSPDRLALIEKREQEASLEEIAGRLMGRCDLVVTEGYKRGNAPKIEVHRRETGRELLCTDQELLAVATDEPLSISAPQFGLDDVAGLVDLLESKMLRQRRDEEIHLLVNGHPIPMKEFVRDIFGRTIMGMVAALRGTESAERVEILLRRKT
jgi:molybdopterin-guanine dinucleotide biosynthesis protein B